MQQQQQQQHTPWGVLVYLLLLIYIYRLTHCRRLRAYQVSQRDSVRTRNATFPYVVLVVLCTYTRSQMQKTYWSCIYTQRYSMALFQWRLEKKKENFDWKIKSFKKKRILLSGFFNSTMTSETWLFVELFTFGDLLWYDCNQTNKYNLQIYFIKKIWKQQWYISLLITILANKYFI